MKSTFATASDLPAIALCHRQAFPSSLASKMGSAYVEKMLSWYLSGDHMFLIVVKDSGVVAGYAGGMLVDGTLAHGSASSMAQFTFSTAIKALVLRPWLLAHREFLTKYKLMARNIGYKFRKLATRQEIRSAAKPSHAYVGLVVIGVSPRFQGKGYGGLLLQDFERVARQRGVMRLSLSVFTANTKAIRLYSQNGWVTVAVAGASTQMEKILD